MRVAWADPRRGGAGRQQAFGENYATDGKRVIFFRGLWRRGATGPDCGGGAAAGRCARAGTPLSAGAGRIRRRGGVSVAGEKLFIC